MALDNNDALVNTIIFMTPVDDTQEFRVTNSVARLNLARQAAQSSRTQSKPAATSITDRLSL